MNTAKTPGRSGGRRDASPQSTAPEDQRRALEQSEQRAAARQPRSYRKEETEDKKVEIGPDPTRAPIKGIDPHGGKSGTGSDGGSGGTR